MKVLEVDLILQHGTDRIIRRGVGTSNILSEDDYNARRDAYYMSCDIDEEKRKSPLSKESIDKAYEKYHSTSFGK